MIMSIGNLEVRFHRVEWQGNPPYDLPPFEWEEVQACLDGRSSMAKYRSRPPWDLPKESCPQCGEPMKALHWANADECWKGLCGIAGWIRYCGPCKGWTPVIGGPTCIN
ncbi:MAG: hypothetical protein IT203_07090 [Fimbriimonadaceae bacterium]|nr:hypothetical protein [Fimbriimonadaceae bacterium]